MTAISINLLSSMAGSFAIASDTIVEPSKELGNARGWAGEAKARMLRRVNFYGHAVVAAWFRTQPAFVLGAMLPDFLTMMGRARSTVDAAPSASAEASSGVLAGLALHRATDAVFHERPEFLALTAQARGTLSRAGLSRGAARGVAHIGIEILLDELLASDSAGRNAYFSALAYGRDAELPIQWTPTEALELRELTDLLSRRGLPESPAPLEVAERLRRIVAGRPRLSFEASQRALVGAWVAEARPSVRAAAPAILGALREHLLDGRIDGVQRVGQKRI